MARRKKTSSKQSDTNIKKRLEETVFFIDRCIYSKALFQALNGLGLNIEIHDNHFENDVEDPVWLIECGKNNWVVLSKDKNIKKNVVERQALLNAGVAAFFLTTGGINAEETAQALIKALKRIANLIQIQQKPFIARINLKGEVKLWIDHKGNDHLTKKNPEKEKNPDEDQNKDRQDHCQQTADICPRFLIPGIRRGTMRAKFFACQKWAFATFADLQLHIFRIN